MLIELSYDFLVQLHFVWTKRYPLELRERIRTLKEEIYLNLIQDLARPDMLSGSRTFTIDGRGFEVSFASDTTQNDPVNDIRQLRVLQIEEVG